MEEIVDFADFYQKINEILKIKLSSHGITRK
jgi:hypothetical protein